MSRARSTPACVSVTFCRMYSPATSAVVVRLRPEYTQGLLLHLQYGPSVTSGLRTQELLVAKMVSTGVSRV